MSIKIDRFEAIWIDRVQKKYVDIKDHSTDTTIVKVCLDVNGETNKLLAKKIISLIEECIEENEIKI